MKPLAAGLLVAAAALCGAPAFAQNITIARTTVSPPMTNAQDPGAGFVQLDTNRDGFIEKTEAARSPGLVGIFDKADANHDGKLDQTEFMAAQKMAK
jgi:hypothetical protein